MGRVYKRLGFSVRESLSEEVELCVDLFVMSSHLDWVSLDLDLG